MIAIKTIFFFFSEESCRVLQCYKLGLEDEEEKKGKKKTGSERVIMCLRSVEGGGGGGRTEIEKAFRFAI